MTDLPAGPGLDALVAQKVMGWAAEYHMTNPRRPTGVVSITQGTFTELPPFSTDMTAAWLIVQHLRPHIFKLGLYNDGWLCSLCVGTDNRTIFEAYGGKRLPTGTWSQEGAALAICRAALAAVADRSAEVAGSI